MVKRKRVFSASNVEEKTDNGLSFETQVDEKKASSRSKVEGGGEKLIEDGIECFSSGERGTDAQLVDTVRSSKLMNKHTCETDPTIDDVEAGNGVGSRRSCTTSGLTLRSSIRTQKRTRRDSSPSSGTSPAFKKRDKASIEVSKLPEKTKTRRAWELWSEDDTNMFFEALCEYGKDFEKIRNFVMQKNSKKGQPPQIIKNKDQVRHFYYRTWHKISKHLDISDDVKKQTQELYGLINYGELRKKIGGRLDEKNGQKLNEMVHNGATTIRYKGKNLRIRTPLCNALKKLNDVEDLKEEENVKLPAKITVEFRPRHNHSWSRVQSVSQNPRLRMNISLQRRLNTVIHYLQRRWREPTVTQRNEVLKCLDQAQNHCEKESFLRIMPLKDAAINTMSLKTAGIVISSSSVSLKNYRKKAHCLGDFATSSSTLTTNSSCKKGSKAKVNSSTDEPKMSFSIEEKGDDVHTIEKNFIIENCGRKSENIISDELAMKRESVAPHELTLKQLLALETAVIDPVSKTDQVFFARNPSFFCDTTPCTNVDVVETMECDGEVRTSVTTDVEVNDEVMDVSTVDAEAVRRGWIAADCGTLTFGEVYLLLGNHEKLILDYEWEYPMVNGTSSKESQSLDVVRSTVTKLTTIMSRLLSIAATTFSDLCRSKQERQVPVPGTCCRCGHSCPLSPKSTSSKTSNAVKSSSIARGTHKNHKSNVVKACTPNDTDASNSMRISQVLTNETVSGAAASPIDVFRRPALTPVQNKVTTGKDGAGSSSMVLNSATSEKAFKEHLHKILPQQRKSKGRMTKSMVVQRELPLLPKAGPAHSMMTLSFIPSASSELAGSFMPVLSTAALATGVTTLSQNPPPVRRVVSLAQSSILQTVGTLKANSVPLIASSSTVSLATLPSNTLGPRTLVSGFHPLSTVAGSPCTVLISNGSLTPTMMTTTASPIIVSSRPSFANRLTASTTSFPVSTCSVTSSLNSLRTVSDLTLETECSSSVSLATSESSSIPVMSISESSGRSNLSISPPTISSLLDISLTGTDTMPMGLDVSNDKLLDLNLGNSNSFSGLMDLTIVGSGGKSGNENVSLTIPLLSGDIGLDHRLITPSHSPTSSLFKISSPGLEGHWLNGDVSEFSLSNLLSHLESPVKTSTPLTSHPESLDTMNRLAPDMETQLQCLISESSVDYIAKFEDLAAQISISDTPKKM